MDRRERMTGLEPIIEEADELTELAGKVVVLAQVMVGAQRHGRELVATRRPADTEIDPTWEQGVEHPEVLDDLVWAAVREHHPAAADPDVRGPGGDLTDQDLGTRPGEGGAGMVLGQPVTLVAEPVGQTGKVDGVAPAHRPGSSPPAPATGRGHRA